MSDVTLFLSGMIMFYCKMQLKVAVKEGFNSLLITPATRLHALGDTGSLVLHYINHLMCYRPFIDIRSVKGMLDLVFRHPRTSVSIIINGPHIPSPVA